MGKDLRFSISVIDIIITKFVDEITFRRSYLRQLLIFESRIIKVYIFELHVRVELTVHDHVVQVTPN